ncbi:hypothetical protein LWI28_009471 [Acer negundo]|uniref:Integrase zinc-binding domain-containing protein n=1 Tax=Acer negundo TaxID=4023 RepID=A0AAD5IYK4_ACENE|nr:hypothetical protein LWI28_009471 [Acer negundo]
MCTDEGTLTAITLPQPIWIQEIQDSYIQDPTTMKELSGLLIDPAASLEYTQSNGILRMHGRIYVGHKGTLRGRLIKEAHGSASGGHSGIKGTVKHLQQYFIWEAINKEVVEWVTICAICQQCKGEHVKSLGLL